MQRNTPALVLSALAALAACDSNDPAKKSEPAKQEPAKQEPAKQEPAKQEPATPEPARTEPEALAPAALVAPKPNEPGPAFFAVDKQGIARLQDGAFKILDGSPPILQKDLQLGPDGALWVIGFEDILRFDGTRFNTVAKASFSDVGGSPDHLSIAPNGDPWISTYKGVSHWDGKAWITEEKAAIGAGDDLLEAIVVDRDGKVWVASSNRVHLRDGAGAWKEVSLKKAKGGKLWLKDLALSPDGHVHVLIDEALIKFGATPNSEASELSKVNVGVKGFAQMSDVNFAQGGSIGIISYKDVYHLPAGGSPRKYSSEKSRDFKADSISAVAADDSGRLWVGSEIGVSVIVPGAARVEWASGSVPELVGDIKEIVVFGAGPKDLPTGGPLATGGLTGTILRDGAPVAGTTVELCPSPSSFFTKSPCHDAPVKFTAKTDAAGVWTVANVPLGSYGLAIKNGKKWSVTLMSDMADGMKAGAVYDTGSMSLDKK
ncbi:MAG: hypothetical protein IPO88_22225 [Nannocystis sp.]|uniref:hypothetical protein n=1 Tax=Nannocystis sp. TaxID=1962667 RepID=UPI00242121BC|nr:hypothetical protein [Nannocystis sp.]MBK9756160.1 hypothetical protein [Nannocystis sp.]